MARWAGALWPNAVNSWCKGLSGSFSLTCWFSVLLAESSPCPPTLDWIPALTPHSNLGFQGLLFFLPEAEKILTWARAHQWVCGFTQNWNHHFFSFCRNGFNSVYKENSSITASHGGRESKETREVYPWPEGFNPQTHQSPVCELQADLLLNSLASVSSLEKFKDRIEWISRSLTTLILWRSFNAIFQHFLLHFFFSSIFQKQIEVEILLYISTAATKLFLSLTSSSLLSTSAVSFSFNDGFLPVVSVTNLFLMEHSELPILGLLAKLSGKTFISSKWTTLK